LLFRDRVLGQWDLSADYFEDDILYGVIPVLFADKGVRESALKEPGLCQEGPPPLLGVDAEHKLNRFLRELRWVSNDKWADAWQTCNVEQKQKKSSILKIWKLKNKIFWVYRRHKYNHEALIPFT
jgi:hypothetical protein